MPAQQRKGFPNPLKLMEKSMMALHLLYVVQRNNTVNVLKQGAKLP